LYKSVLERLIIAVADEDDEDLTESPGQKAPGLTVHEERLRVWPPWPWPPWDPQDPDHPDQPGDGKPLNRTKEAPKLAKAIVEFEKKLANASLDL
jgi:endothelin-converting enzyme